MQQLIDLFSKIPGFAWSSSENGSRTIGTTEGFILDIWPDRVEAAGIFAADRIDVASRNGTLFQLLLMAMRPDWQSAPAWLAAAMRRHPREEINVSRGVRFTWDAAQSRATLRIQR